MSVTYRFVSLKSLADYIDNCARELRASADFSETKKSRTKVDIAQKRGEATAHESIAHMLRNTKIGDV